MKKDTVLIFSGDPGSKNFALSVTRLQFKDGKVRMKVLGTGMMPDKDRVVDLTGNVGQSLARFNGTFDRLEKTYGKPDIVSLERFQTRGIKGKTIECISMMNAVALHRYRNIYNLLITASTWKNRVNRVFPLDDTYKEYGLLTSSKKALKYNHELDATLIGIYAACRYFDIPYFEFIEDRHEAFMDAWMDSPRLDL